MAADDATVESLAKQGRDLLKESRPVNAHDGFHRWHEHVADWLDKEFPNTGRSAEWSSLATSTLGTGNQYDGSPRGWDKFKNAVGARLKWLAQLGGSIFSVQSQGMPAKNLTVTNDVFVVHGRDQAMKQHVARTLAQLGLN